MGGVASGRAGIVQGRDGKEEVGHAQLSHHGHQHIPGIIPAPNATLLVREAVCVCVRACVRVCELCSKQFTFYTRVKVTANLTTAH